MMDKKDIYIYNGHNHLTLIPTDECKDTLEKYKEIWRKIKDFIISTNNKSDGFDEKYMTSKLNPDDDLPLKKALKLNNIRITARSIFNDSKKYYIQIFLDASLYKLVG